MSTDDSPRLKLLVSNASIILAQLRGASFRRMELQIEVADSAEEILTALDGDAGLPDAVVLQFCPSRLDAFRLCQQIREELGHADLPLVVISETSISQNMLVMINESGCDEVLTAPLSPGQLHFVLCKYLKMPERCEEQLASACPVTVQGDTLVRGRVCDVSTRGVRIQLPEAFEARPGQQVRCSFGAEPDMQLEAEVVWRRASGESGTELALRFDEVPEGLVSRLENLATWRLEAADGHQVVILHKSLTEASSFDELVPQINQPVVFDLRRVAVINSIGVSRWIGLLRQLDERGIACSFAHCSVSFCTQANYLPEMLGKGKVTSFFIPLECPRCTREEEREVQADQISPIEAPNLPLFVCTGCGTTLCFADLPQRFFQFLALQ